jgi:hypothetical protein
MQAIRATTITQVKWSKLNHIFILLSASFFLLVPSIWPIHDENVRS